MALVDRSGSGWNSNPPKAEKIRWGELDEADGEDLDFLLPPRQVIGPEENGIKKVIEYKFNEDGNKVKITTTTRVRKLAKARLSKRAVERRSWAKFGTRFMRMSGVGLPWSPLKRFFLKDLELRTLLSIAACNCSQVTALPNQVSTPSLTRTPLTQSHDWLLLACTKAEETKIAGDSLAQLGKGGAVLMVCRTCGKKGDHWTSRCPYKDLAAQTDAFVDKPPAAETTVATTGTGKAAYVPPGMRPGAERVGSDMRRRNEENSVRVTNLSEDTREPDLHELFRTFGPVSRVYVAIDQKTGMSRGFGFVNFVNKEDAERAINKLNGYGYDNLILRVEWATPRTN
ncbi:Eukaryotic translation initiation factor 3 subunit G-B [Vitis vinifera]|uniref:Eukaryotic translation initiation factor 3 subunit G n=1 Tax=Vitis vinifera TaxID=29760 RepID=A0A438ENB4_VITVI|nr:Eukaryotic translation initiation factor 3 subunit G-B [Vitis vinifera]